VPTLVAASTIAPLSNRLAYLAYATPTMEELAVLDTSVPASTTADASDMGVSLTQLPFTASALIGTRPLIPTAPGGEVTLFRNSALGGGGQFEFYTAMVVAGSTSVSTTPVLVAPSYSPAEQAGVGSYLAGGPADIFALPPPTADGGPQLVQYDPVAGKPSGTAIPFPTSAALARFTPVLAISECSGIAFVGEVTGTTLHAIPLTAGGSLGQVSVPSTITSVRFEPYGGNLLAAYDSGGVFGIAALSLGGSKTAPTLTAKASWISPADLHPNTIAVRQPIPFSSCP
jgi:hypothetical protein